MSTINTYFDAFLNRHCTEEREARAYDDVDSLGTFAAAWRDKLAVARCYVIVCLECQSEAEDLYGVKLKHYRSEFESILAQARSATPDNNGNTRSPLSISIARG